MRRNGEKEVARQRGLDSCVRLGKQQNSVSYGPLQIRYCSTVKDSLILWCSPVSRSGAVYIQLARVCRFSVCAHRYAQHQPVYWPSKLLSQGLTDLRARDYQCTCPVSVKLDLLAGQDIVERVLIVSCPMMHCYSFSAGWLYERTFHLNSQLSVDNSVSIHICNGIKGTVSLKKLGMQTFLCIALCIICGERKFLQAINYL